MCACVRVCMGACVCVWRCQLLLKDFRVAVSMPPATERDTDEILEKHF